MLWEMIIKLPNIVTGSHFTVLCSCSTIGTFFLLMQFIPTRIEEESSREFDASKQFLK